MFRRGILGILAVLFPMNVMAQGVSFSASGEAKTGEKPTVQILDDIEPVGEASEPDSEAASMASGIPEGFDDKLDYGHSLYLKGDYAGALNVYNLAKEMKSNDPLVLYFIACAEAKLGHLDEAVSALSAMKTLSGEKLPSLTAKALFLTALVEEMRRDDERVISAWTEYKTFIEKHSQLPGFSGSAEARIQAFQKKRELYEQYEVVRQRISTSN